MGRRGGPRRAIRRQRRGRLLELNLGRRVLDAFVRLVLPLGGGSEEEKGEIGEKDSTCEKSLSVVCWRRERRRRLC